MASMAKPENKGQQPPAQNPPPAQSEASAGVFVLPTDDELKANTRRAAADLKLKVGNGNVQSLALIRILGSHFGFSDQAGRNAAQRWLRSKAAHGLCKNNSQHRQWLEGKKEVAEEEGGSEVQG